MNVVKKIIRVFVSPHSQNVWAYIDTIGYRKVQMLSTDGSTNMFVVLTAARTSGIPVNITLSNATATAEITIIYL
jgi:immune inhibitor A